MRVLAIGAHPDDIEIACSGTLAKCVKRGDKVIVCHASTGNLGHVIIPPDKLTEIRKREAEKAGSLAGIEVIGGMFNDLDIFADNKQARDKMVEVIKYAQPDFIITHDPDDYMPDHTETSSLSIPHSRALVVKVWRKSLSVLFGQNLLNSSRSLLRLYFLVSGFDSVSAYLGNIGIVRVKFF